jgi:hypothetical protein
MSGIKKLRKRASDMRDRVKDNLDQLIEILLLIACMVLPLFVDVQGMFGDYLKNNYLTPNNIIPYLSIKGGKYVLAIVLTFFCLLEIWKHNKEFTMNKKNIYHNYSYFWYWFCAKVLGIKKCSLILVPIYMQFKLVIQSTFEDYPLDQEDYPVIDDETDIKMTKTNWSGNKSEVNLIFEDTYNINLNQIPCEKRNLPTIKISRNDGSTNGRHFSQNFIESIINETRGLRSDVRVNVYATTNPMNTYNIAKRVFKNATRGNIAELYVFQQESTGNRLFKRKSKKIF